MTIKTLGRRPTLGETIDYYMRDSFVQFLLDACRARRVVMVVPQRLHWEPNWERDEILARNTADLRREVLAKIAERLPGMGSDDRPAYYPSFHQSVSRHVGGRTLPDQEGNRSARSAVQDCVFEADLPTWRDSFRDVYAILAMMDRYGAYYQHKFSGHRSLHITVPAEALPRGYRSKGGQKLARRLLSWSSSQAHRLPRITRMPYSLNEDTGLVCLPIEQGALPAFRPWQANLHLVQVRDIWQGDDLEDAPNRMQAFLEGLEISEEVEPGGALAKQRFWVDRDRIVSGYRSRLRSLKGEGEIGEAWQLLSGDQGIAERVLLHGLAYTEPDARWLAVEAFLLNGTRLSEQGFLRLSEQDEEYVSPVATDVLLQFETDIMPYLIEMVSDLDQLPAIGGKAMYLLTQSDSLRNRVLDAIVRHAERSRNAVMMSACLMGSLIGDWAGAYEILEDVRNASDLTDKHRARLAALELMGSMGGWNKKEEASKSAALAALGRDTIDLLLVAAKSPFRRFRRSIITALAMMADERAIDLLISSLGDEFSQVRRKAIPGLIRIGEPAVDALVQATASDQIPVRRYAVLCLGRIGASRAKPAILEALEDGEEVVRRQAIRALQGMVCADDIEQLQQVLRGASWENALEATEVLEALGETARQAMEEMAFAEGTLAAAYFIARHGDKRGNDILAARLEEEDGQTRDAAMEFLRELRDERCVPAIAQKLRTITHWYATFLACELGRIGTPAAFDALVEALSREHAFVRRGAVRGLAEMSDPRRIAILIGCLGDSDSKVRRLAADALKAAGEAAVGPLERALAGGRMQVRHHQKLVRSILEKLGADARRGCPSPEREKE